MLSANDDYGVIYVSAAVLPVNVGPMASDHFGHMEPLKKKNPEF